MSIHARALLSALTAASLVAGLSGCSKRRADAAPVAPPAPLSRSAPPAQPPPGPLSEPQTQADLPPPQSVPDGAAPAQRGPFAYEASEPAATPARPPQASRPPQTVAENPAPPQPPPAEATTPAEVPQLGPLISEQQRQVYQREIDRNLDQTQAALNTLNARSLNPDQVEGVRRIREFQRQVREARETDAALARNLSERARLLAEDLVRNTR